MRRTAFTLIDMLVVLLIIGLLASLLLPALQAARESARATICSDNLKQIGFAAGKFSSAKDSQLPNNVVAPFTSWNTLLLPYLDETELFSKYDLGNDWFDGANSKNRALGETRIAVFQCNSAPHAERWIRLQDVDGAAFRMAPSDYVGSAGAYLNNNMEANLYRGAMAVPGRNYGASDTVARSSVKVAEVTDGTSHTTLVVEMADKPNIWRAEKLFKNNLDPQSPPTLVSSISAGQWSAPNWNHLRSYDRSGTNQFEDCAVNCSNSASIYSFHPNGANVLFVDGSVHFLRARLPQEIMVALVSINGSEILTKKDYED